MKKTLIGLIAVAAVFAVVAGCNRDQRTAASARRDGNNLRAAGGATLDRTVRRGPPPEALAACQDKTEGAECSFTGGRGETVAGACRANPEAGGLECFPTNPPGRDGRGPDDAGPGPAGRRGPPPESFSACEGKADGAECSFTGRRGDTLTGACGKFFDTEKLNCRPAGGPPRDENMRGPGPDGMRGPGGPEGMGRRGPGGPDGRRGAGGPEGMGGPGGDADAGPAGHRGPPPESFAACQGKAAGDQCSFTGRRGDTMTGACRALDGAELHCAPANRPTAGRPGRP